jgi:hypothetical protein
MASSYKIPLSKPYFPRSALSSDKLEFWVGLQEQVDRVVRGLLASAETHYLITGYPGVGKSSFVARVVADWRRLSAARGISRLLIFDLHLARPQSPEEIVKRLIGKVYFASIDGQFAPAQKLSERLELNYIQAHSKSLKETQEQTSSHESSKEGKIDFPAVATILGGGIGGSSKTSKEISRSLEVQKEYNLSMAATDFESVLHLLSQTRNFQLGLRERLWRRILKSSADNNDSRTLFIFDQIDDLDFVQELSGFLNLPKASFIVLGGPKLQEQVSSAKEQGIHVLDNFDEVYLACQWNSAQEILSALVNTGTVNRRNYTNYLDYLNFCAQGLPRRLFAAMDRHTARSGSDFYLDLPVSEQKRVGLCAQLHRILWKHRREVLGPYIDSVQHPYRDKALRGAYHLTDRIFRVAKFSLEDADTVATQISAGIMHPSRQRVLRNLLNLFERYGLLVRDGSTLSLSENVLNRVKHIPDWLRDGYVDARGLLDEVQRLGVTPTMPGMFSEGSKPSLHEFDSNTSPGIGEETVLRRKATQKKETHRTDLEINTVIGGRYVIEKKLGQGGVGSVYLARDSRLMNKRVVVKLLFRTDNDWVVRKFHQEREALARVDHPGIVGVLDVGEAPDGAPYIVMQYVDGITLRAALTPEGMALERVTSIVEQVTAALGAAHDRGIIHRDLKPENIMLWANAGSQEQVKIIDFGIAKIRDSLIAPETITGSATAGTVLYMSPEQLRGASVAASSDIYTLGVITYEMVTGRRPFQPETAAHLLEMERAGVRLKPSDLRRSLSAETDRVILKALSFEPTNRHKTAGEFGEHFLRALTEQGGL